MPPLENPYSHYQEKSVADDYDHARFTSLAGRSFDRLEKHNIRKAFRSLPSDSLILDAPCGTGRLAEVLLEEGHRVVGMDISDEMLQVARDKLARFGQRFTTTVTDLRHLPEAQIGQYDAVLCARVLMHLSLDEQITFLGNVARLTQGTVVFTQSWTSPYQKMRRRVKRMLGTRSPARYPVSRPDLHNLLTGAGLREVRKLRPMAAITEEVIVLARPVSS